MIRSIARLRVMLATLTVLAAAAAICVPAASAALTHEPLGEVGAGYFGPGSEPSAVAVDDQSGDVYVFTQASDQKTGMVLKFTATGEPAEIGTTGSNTLGPFATEYLYNRAQGGQVAVDNSGGANDGTLYVASSKGVYAFRRNGSAGSFPGAGTEAEGNLLKSVEGSTLEATALTVDSQGDLYAGTVSGSVQVFTPTGEHLTSTAVEQADSLAVAPSGLFYPTANFIEPEVPGHVQIETPMPYPVESTTTYEVAAPQFQGSHGDAVDPRSENVLILGAASIAEYEPAGTTAEPDLAPVTTFAAGELQGTTRGLGIDGNDGDVYVAVGTQVLRYGPLVKTPDVVTGAATDVNSVTDTATLHGTVDPLGEAITGCEFEYGPSKAYGQTAPCVETPSGNGPQAVHADISGLVAANYHFRLTATGPDGTGRGADAGFRIAAAPTIESEEATPGNAEATFTATINPGNAATTYFFEYGTGTSYGSRTATGSIAAGLTGRTVSIAVSGLTPGAEYHYRVVATNELGTTPGADRTFVTTTGTAAGGCPNEALRLGYSALLPECRAYEMVSPVDKSGGDVYPLAGVQASPSGEAVTFTSAYQFAGQPSKALTSVYLASRGTDGWTTSGIEAPQRNTKIVLEIPTIALTADLGKTVQVSTEALAPGALEHGVNIYLRDDATGSRTLLQALPGEEELAFFTIGQQAFVGIAPDASTVLLQGRNPIEGEGVVGFGGTNLFEYAGGVRHLISTLPDGTPIRTAAPVHAVSADARRVIFQSAEGNDSGALYLHEAGRPSVALTHVANPAPFQQDTVTGTTPFISSDGSTAVFAANEGFLEASGPIFGSSTIYSYDSATGEEKPLIKGPNGAQVTTILAASRNLEYVYFGSTAKLTADAPEEESGVASIYVWQKNAPAGQAIRFIGKVQPGEVTSGSNLGQVSPDGRSYAFASPSRLTSDDAESPACGPSGTSPAVCTQVFEYEVGTGKLSCTSCGAPGRPGTVLGGTKDRASYSNYQPRAVLDGGVVYFETSSALSPRDSNGTTDVYQWRDGTARLISSGTSGSGSFFADTADGGRDVFFKTNQSLVTQDTDPQLDLYDARVDGGIAAQNRASVSVPCEGEACRGSSPSLPSLGSGAAPSCHGFAQAAKRQSARAKALSRKAKKAKGRRARKLRAQAKGARRQAAHQRRENAKCGRQGR